MITESPEGKPQPMQQDREVIVVIIDAQGMTDAEREAIADYAAHAPRCIRVSARGITISRPADTGWAQST
jgi:hypothetical protein